MMSLSVKNLGVLFDSKLVFSELSNFMLIKAYICANM